ncbi:MAG: ABC transporter ATP-binding protein [Calditrichia bacterium]
MITLTAEKIGHHYAGRTILKDISFSINSGQCLAIVGPNGSGKSTLVKILSGLLSAKTGTHEYSESTEPLENFQRRIGLVTPYLQLYRDLTALENLTFFASAHQIALDNERIKALFAEVGLVGREHDALRSYSSGMMQRAKYIMALYHQPDILILDEPTANLDQSGCDMVYALIEKMRSEKLVVLATNEPREAALADKGVPVVTK